MAAVSLSTALARGFTRRCPKCGVGRSFAGYLKVADHCSHCGEQLGHIRADDAPPYFTILIVGHIMVWLVVGVQQTDPQPMGVTIVMAVSLTIGLMLALLPIIKGAVLAVMWRLNLSGDEFQ